MKNPLTKMRLKRKPKTSRLSIEPIDELGVNNDTIAFNRPTGGQYQQHYRLQVPIHEAPEKGPEPPKGKTYVYNQSQQLPIEISDGHMYRLSNRQYTQIDEPPPVVDNCLHYRNYANRNNTLGRYIIAYVFRDTFDALAIKEIRFHKDRGRTQLAKVVRRNFMVDFVDGPQTIIEDYDGGQDFVVKAYYLEDPDGFRHAVAIHNESPFYLTVIGEVLTEVAISPIGAGAAYLKRCDDNMTDVVTMEIKMYADPLSDPDTEHPELTRDIIRLEKDNQPEWQPNTGGIPW